MRYRAEVEINHVARGEPLSDLSWGALLAAITDVPAAAPASLIVSDLVLTRRTEDVALVSASIRGRTIADLTSPLDAITCLDEALLRALIKTGLFEEFDVARRSVHARPVDS